MAETLRHIVEIGWTEDLMILSAFILALAQAPPTAAAPSTAAPSSTPAQPPTTSRFEKLPTPPEEVPVGSRVTRRSDYVTADERDAAWTMHRFAECLVRTRERQMLEFLSTRLNSPEQNRIVRDVIGWKSRCLQARSMQIDHILLRGAVAEALYRQELRGRQIGRLSRAPELLEADPARNSSAALERFGRCMMANHPALVRPLIGTRPGSREEREALSAIQAALPVCLAQAPARARHPLMLRGALAEAFYLHRHGLLGSEAQAGAGDAPAATQQAGTSATND
jgi:hypothetical protein